MAGVVGVSEVEFLRFFSPFLGAGFLGLGGCETYQQALENQQNTQRLQQQKEENFAAAKLQKLTTPLGGCYNILSLNSNYLLYSSAESIKCYVRAFWADDGD